MNILTLLPYEGIEYCGVRLCYGMLWTDVQRLLGNPDHRFLDFTPKDYDQILTSAGQYKKDYFNQTPSKLDFIEQRSELELVYENGLLTEIEVFYGCGIQINDLTLNHNGQEDYTCLVQRYELDFFEERSLYMVRALGIVVRSIKKGGYLLCSPHKYRDHIMFERFWAECKKFDDERH